MSERRLHEVVLGASRRAPRRSLIGGALVALLLHVGGAAAALSLGATREPAPRPSRPLVVFEHVVELDPPAPPPVTPPPEPPPAPPPVVRPPPKPVQKPAPQAVKAAPTPAAELPAQDPPPSAPEPPPSEQSEPPPAAQAGQVVAAKAEAPASAPSFQIATGSASGFAGGTTASNGTSTKANATGQVGVGDGKGLGRARLAQVRSRDWPCGWPPEAEELELEEAFVTVQAVVRPDGTLADLKVLSDPGYGFARRVASCARSKIKFEPALDDAGRPTLGSTATIRVRFTREE